MNRNIVIALLSAAVVGLGAVCVHQYRQALRVPPPPAGRRYATSARTAPDPSKDWIAPSRSTSATRRDAPVRRDDPAPAAEPAGGGMKPAAMILSGVAQMLKSPAMKNMLRGQQKVAIDMQYGQLFSCLDLTPEKMETLKELLLDRQMAFMDSGLDLIAPGASESERKTKAENLARTKAEFDQKIGDLVGAENASLYTQYEETQPERMQVQIFKQSLAGGDALTPEQEHDLIRGMYDERQNLASESPAGGTEAQNVPPMTEAAMQKALEQMQKLDERYAERAVSVLNPVQMEQFRKTRQQQRAMQQMGIKIATQVMGQPEK